MTTWYDAVCFEHEEKCSVLTVSDGGRDAETCAASTLTWCFNEEDVPLIKQFLSRHYGCELQFFWRDDQCDQMYEACPNLKDALRSNRRLANTFWESRAGRLQDRSKKEPWTDEQQRELANAFEVIKTTIERKWPSFSDEQRENVMFVLLRDHLALLR